MGWLPEIGDVVLGKYRVVRALGQGGMGVVFEAINLDTEGHVALKMLKPADDSSTDRSSRMGREARAVAKLRSRFVARVVDFEQTSDGGPVLVMELLQGRDLSAELRVEKSLALDDVLSYAIQACAGVAEAHSLGIIHRDLKPGNLFLDVSQGTTPIVRVLDFGLSKQLEADFTTDLTSPSEALGTLAYMSPEQVRATRDVDARTDVWALGVILYRALMGRLPLQEKGYAIATRLMDARPLPRVEREDVPRELASVIARALEKDAARRIPDARVLGKMLQPFAVHPSPPTKLAFDELDAMPSAYPSAVDVLDGDDDTTQAKASTVRAVVDDRTSVMPPRRKKRRRPTIDMSSRETRYVLAGSGILVIATILVAATTRPHPSAPAPAAQPVQTTYIAPVVPDASIPPPRR